MTIAATQQRRPMSRWHKRRLHRLRKVELSPEEQVIARMRFGECRSLADIAAALGLTVPRVSELCDSLTARAEAIERQQQDAQRIRAHERREALRLMKRRRKAGRREAKR